MHAVPFNVVARPEIAIAAMKQVVGLANKPIVKFACSHFFSIENDIFSSNLPRFKISCNF